MPATRSVRVAGIDIARCLAVVGMIGAHTLTVADLSWSPDGWAAIVHGRSSILFAVLGGLSLTLMSGRGTPPHGDALVRARLRIVVRAALLFVLGGVLSALGTPIAVILPVYGVLFIAAVPFLTWRPRRLLMTAAIWAVVAPVLVLLLGPKLSGDPSGIVAMVIGGTYPALVWITFLLLGLAIGRSDLTALRVRWRMVFGGAVASVVGYGGAWVATTLVGGEPNPVKDNAKDVGCGGGSGKTPPGSLNEGSEKPVLDSFDAFADKVPGKCAPTAEWSSLLTAQPHSGTTFEILGSGGLAVALIGLVLLIPLSRLALVLLAPVTALGSMTLTVYALHAVSMVWLEPTDEVFVWSVAVAAVFCTLWVVLFGRGPLERAVTWVSRRAAQPKVTAGLAGTRE